MTTTSRADTSRAVGRAVSRRWVVSGAGDGAVMRDRQLAAVLAFAVAVVTLAVFLPALDNEFVAWDDEVLFTTNEEYRGLGWRQLQWMFTTIKMGHYVPVTWLTHGLDYVLWGMDPSGYHLTNVLIHAANAALVYFVAARLLGAVSVGSGLALSVGAAVAALFFALHPLRAESVAWVTERRDVLSGLFFLLTLLCYLRARDVDGASRIRRHAAACLFYVLAMLSKSMVMTLPALLILLDVYPFRRLGWDPRSWREAGVWREKTPYLALGVVAAMLGYYAQAANSFITPATDIPWSARPPIVAFGLWFYASKTFLPTGLSPLYELPPTISFLGPRFVVPIVGVVAATATAVLLRRRCPGLLAATVAYALLIAPVVGIVHSGYQLAHDRYSYLPCLSWAIVVGAGAAWIASEAARRHVEGRVLWAARVALVAWLGAMAILTWEQVQVWKNTATLWQYATDAEPNCTVCLYNQGALLYNTGHAALAKDRFERIIAVRPDRARARGNLALANASTGDLNQAVLEYRAMLARMPDDVEAHNNLGALLTTLGRPHEAIREFRWAIRLEDQPLLHVNLALALLDTGDLDGALAEVDRAIAAKPDLAQARFALGLVHQRRGDHAAARHQLQILRALDTGLARVLGPALVTEW